MELSLNHPSAPPDEAFHRAFESGLHHERKRLGQTHPLYINGRACRSHGKTMVNLCPADTRVVLGKFQSATREHVRKAIVAAQKAYPFWRELGWEQRLAFIRKTGELMAKYESELTALLCLEVGKTRYEAWGEVREAIEVIRLYGQQMESHQGYRFSANGHGSERVYNLLEPYGVWGVVAPFDSPLEVATSMIAAALLTGNTIVYKPSGKTPLIGLRLYDLFHQAGLPVGIVNCLTGPGEEIGVELASNPDLNGFIFTGSKAVGLSIHQRFNHGYPRPCIMEMRGKNPVVVMPSATLDDAAEGVIRSAFAMSGQTSSACSRVYVHQKILKDFVELLVEKGRACKVGDPAERDTVLGPLIDADSVEDFKQAVRLGKRDGRLLWGGHPLQDGDLAYGHYVEATILDQLKKDSLLFNQESPLPILAVTEIRSLEEAIGLCNAGHYGLAAGIYTQVDDEQERFFARIEAGVVVCNRRAGATFGARSGLANFSGWKASGSTGRNALGPYYVSQFMREQSRTICW
jgi:1-pyrroline-5-carboxylate dehydrogenase